MNERWDQQGTPSNSETDYPDSFDEQLKTTDSETLYYYSNVDNLSQSRTPELLDDWCLTSLEVRHKTIEVSHTTPPTLNLANLDPRLIDGIGSEDNQVSDRIKSLAIRPVYKRESARDESSRPSRKRKRERMHLQQETASKQVTPSEDCKAELPQQAPLDPVQTLRAKCAGWYLTKWVDWDDKDNERRRLSRKRSYRKRGERQQGDLGYLETVCS